MFKDMIARLTKEAARTGKEAQDKIGRANFIKVWQQDDAWFISVTSPNHAVDPVVLAGVRNDSGWKDLREVEMPRRGYVFTGLPPEQPAQTSLLIDELQMRTLHAVGRDNGFDHDNIRALATNLWGCKSLKDLTVPQYQQLRDVILPQGYTKVAARNFYRKGA